MPAPKKRGTTLRPFVARLGELATGLPSRSELEEAKTALDDIVSFLADVRRNLDKVPASEDSLAIAASIKTFDRLLDIAEKNAAVRSALGLAAKRTATPAPRPIAAEQEESGRRLFDSFSDMTLDQVRERLTQDSSISLSDLRSLAAFLRVRFQAKSNRDTLAQSLVSAVANARAYRGLREGADG